MSTLVLADDKTRLFQTQSLQVHSESVNGSEVGAALTGVSIMAAWPGVRKKADYILESKPN